MTSPQDEWIRLADKIARGQGLFLTEQELDRVEQALRFSVALSTTESPCFDVPTVDGALRSGSADVAAAPLALATVD